MKTWLGGGVGGDSLLIDTMAHRHKITKKKQLCETNTIILLIIVIINTAKLVKF